MSTRGNVVGTSLALLLVTLLAGGCPLATDPIEDQSTDDESDVADVNMAPIAGAGTDQTVTAGTQVVLDGSTSLDADGDRLGYIWRQTGGTAVQLQDAFSSRPRFFAPDNLAATTVITFRLTVADGLATATDEVSITVSP